jgi:hypothetical protein
MSMLDAERELRGELAPGERLLWSGRPRQGLLLRPGDWLLIPFSVLWGGFAVFWEATVIAQGGSPLMVLWGVPFVLVGLHMMVGRFLLDARLRARTFYGLTAERAIIVGGLLRREVKSVPLRSLAEVGLQERRDRSGTVTLGPGPGSPITSWPGAANAVPAFELVENARQVYDRVRAAQAEAARTGTS